MSGRQDSRRQPALPPPSPCLQATRQGGKGGSIRRGGKRGLWTSIAMIWQQMMEGGMSDIGGKRAL